MAGDDGDLAELQAFLESDDAPGDCMDVSELDGFLTGLAAGPAALPPGEWLPRVWGEAGGTASSRAGQAAVLISARRREIARRLDRGGAVDPLFWETESGGADASDWARGFMAAVDLAPEAWMPILDDPEARDEMMPILALAADGDGKPLVHLAEAERARIAAGAETLIPAAVAAIAAFWRLREPSASRRSD